MISNNLLTALHQSRYTYYNSHVQEFYIWHGMNIIKIHNCLGEQLGEFNIINYAENRVYKKFETINIRDVTISIDDIVTNTYKQ